MWRTPAMATLAGTALALTSPGATVDRPARDRADAEPPVPDGLLVIAALSPERAIVADPRTGRTTERELPGGTLCHGPLLAAGGHVVLAGWSEGRTAALAVPMRRPAAAAAAKSSSAPGGARRPAEAGALRASSAPGGIRSLGRADILAASSSPRRVWVGRYEARGRTARVSLREVDARGRVSTRIHDRVAHGGWIQGVVDGGLLIARSRALVLRGPDKRRVRIRGGWPLATDGARLAWCGRHCRRVGLWTPDGERVFEPPPGMRPEQGPEAAFSPDGRRLALPVQAGGRPRAAVIDLESGAWRLVPGARLSDYRALAWSPSGRWLYFSRGSGIMASRGAVDRAVRLPIRTRGTVMSIASPLSTP